MVGVLAIAASQLLLCLCVVASGSIQVPPHLNPASNLRLPPPDVSLNVTAPVVTFNASVVAWTVPDMNLTLLSASLSASAANKSLLDHPGFHFPGSNFTSLEEKRSSAAYEAHPNEAIAAKPLDAPVGGVHTAVVSVGASSTPASNTLTSFAGASANDLLSQGFYSEPPDQALCVSPDWVYEVVNGVIIVFTKQGARVLTQTIDTFFNPPVPDLGNVFDPRCTYDEATGLVFFAAASYNGGTTGNTGYLLVVVLQPTPANPTAGAKRVQVSADRTNFPTTGCKNSAGNTIICYVASKCNGGTKHCWGDYPMMAVDASFVWITVNMFTATAVENYAGSMAFAVGKNAILTSGTVPVYLFDLTYFGSTPQPAITQFGSPYPGSTTSAPVMYFTTNGFDASNNPAVCIAAVYNAAALLTGGTATLINGLCRALDYADIGDIKVPTPGGVSIGGVDSRMMQTPFMKGTIWGSFHTFVTVGGAQQVGVVYFNTAGLTSTASTVTFTIGTYGYLGLTGSSVIDPSIAPFPDVPTTAVIGVSVTSATSIYLTFGYSIVNTNPAVNLASTIHLVSTTGPLKSDPYNRVGDYTATCVAPDGSVWTAGMSALPSFISNGYENWNTWITQVILPPTAVCTPSPITLQSAPGSCTTFQTSAALIAAINAGSLSPGFTPTITLTPPGGSYVLTQDQSYPFTLNVANPAGTDTCQTTIIVPAIPPPTAVCNAAVMYTSTDGSPVIVTAADLLTAIDNGSHSNGGDSISRTLTPGAVGGSYSLPVGQTTFTLTVTNCAGSNTCGSTVTVVVQATSTIPATSSAPATTSSTPASTTPVPSTSTPPSTTPLQSTTPLPSTTLLPSTTPLQSTTPLPSTTSNTLTTLVPVTSKPPMPSTTLVPSTTPAPPTSSPGLCNPVCKPAATIAAQSNCAAQPTDEQIFAAIDNGSTGAPTVLPAAISGGYNLPVGTYKFTLSCSASNFCISTVTVADQEILSTSNIKCGSVPADGVLVTSPLTKYDTSKPAALYVPSYTKANGCPVNATATGLSCADCIFGASFGAARGRFSTCAVNTKIGTNETVSIGMGQIGRIAWTVIATDTAGHFVTGACAVCVDHGRLPRTTFGACPRPFTTTTPCLAGHL